MKTRKPLRFHAFSEDRLYRYTLWREFPDILQPYSGDYLMVIGLNPSTADETQDDPTLRRCIGLAKRLGYGALCMANLFAWRATDPKQIKAAADPIGPLNPFHLFLIAKSAGMIIAAWGKHGSHLNRATEVRSIFADAKFRLHALQLNKDGSPAHPLYLKSTLTPFLL